MDLNQVTLFGRVGKDPELRNTAGGDPICSFGIANSSWKKGKNGEWEEETSWFDCTLFGDAATRFVERTKKGHKVIIVGQLKQRTWKDKDDNRQERIGITVRQIQYLEKKPKGSDNGASESAPATSTLPDTPF